MKSLWIVFCVVIFLIVALTVRYNASQNAPKNGVVPSSTTSSGSPTSNVSSPSTGKMARAEKIAFAPPKKDASQAEKDAWLAAITYLNTRSDKLTITNCDSIAPKVVSTTVKATVSLVNDDRAPHTITFLNNKPIKIDPHSSQPFLVTYSATGVYRYSCDDKTIAGYFYVFP